MMPNSMSSYQLERGELQARRSHLSSYIFQSPLIPQLQADSTAIMDCKHQVRVAKSNAMMRYAFLFISFFFKL